MIKNRFLTYFFGIVFLVGFASCEDYFGDINENPNNPTDVTPDVLLPGIEVQLNYIYGGDFSRFASVITQHVEGIDRQWASINAYTFIVPANFNTAWRTNMYAGVLQDVRILKDKAVETGSNHYEGMADVLLAYALMISTDAWGDIPYDDAFQGVDNIEPVFDTQESIYALVDQFLSEAKTLLSQEATGIVPSSNDFIYGGDAAQWLKFANVIQARSYLHRAEVDAGNYNLVLTELNQGFESAGDDARMPYGAGATAANPWSQFNRDRQGDIAANPDLAARLEALNDPRRAIYGDPDVFFPEDHPVMQNDWAYPFATYVEVEFMKAEALLATGGDAQAIYDAYIAGITADMVELGADQATIDAYLAQPEVDPGVGNITLEHIIMQKHFALWTEFEVFNDWRRTGIPQLEPNSGSSIPIRFPYAETEILFNPNTPDMNIFTDPVWWDR